ncbi:MAG: TIGR04283 family arsenosugar biosynthesis glycosyltransferase [Terriglobia bacterium]
MGSRSSTISVIVPAYNEEDTIGALLENLRQLKPEEIIVADGNSTDRTAEIAVQSARVVTSARGRGIQMNAGARESSGDVLLFLHADVRLHPSGLEKIRESLRDPSIVGGDFDVRYQGGDWMAAIFTSVNRWRRRAGIFYGDSGIFCRRSVFEALGGYRPWPVLEDYDFVRRLRKAGKLVLLNEPVWVSDRRWRNLGLFRTVWSWFWIQTLFFAGVRPERLAMLYRDTRSGDSPVGVCPNSLNGRAGSFRRPQDVSCGASQRTECATTVTLSNGSEKE